MINKRNKKLNKMVCIKCQAEQNINIWGAIFATNSATYISSPSVLIFVIILLIIHIVCGLNLNGMFVMMFFQQNLSKLMKRKFICQHIYIYTLPFET